MATGWGGMGAGAWSKAPTPVDDEEDPNFPSKNPAPNPLYSNSGNQPVPAGFNPPPVARNSSLTRNSPSPGASSGAYANLSPAQLQQKAAELDKREKMLAVAERALMDQGALRKKNWPWFFPDSMKIMYHDIVVDIPEGSRRVVREMYYCWLGLCFCLFFNWICASTILSTGDAYKVSSWFLALVYLVLGPIISMWSWYGTIYYAAKYQSNLRYWWFFFNFTIHMLFCIWCCIAVPILTAYWSFAGWITAFDALSKYAVPGIFYVVGAVLWSCLTAYSFWCLKDCWFFFRGLGGVEQVKQDAAVAAFKSGIAQQAAAQQAMAQPRR